MLVHVLGTAQDGGVPHPGCTCPRCEAAQADPQLARTASSLAIQAGPGAMALLFDCAPEFPRQMALLKQKVGPTPGRPLPIAGIFLTHAHVGHYLGLPFLGREAFSAKNLPVTCTPAMASFLQDNRPFQHLARRGEIVLCPTIPGLPVDLQGLKVTAFHVQHRNEDADTVGSRIEAGGKRVLFVPDFDVYDEKVLAEIRAADHTCNNWTSNGAGSAHVGHSDRVGNGNQSWNSSHATTGCSQRDLVSWGGVGLLYCFAVN